MLRTDVIIPVYRPDRRFFELLRRLSLQTVRPERIILMNTEQRFWEEAEGDLKVEALGLMERTEVHHVTRAEFDHGHTRNLGAGYGKAPYFVMMTQDALPADRYLIERLLDPMEGQRAAVPAAMCYARQLPEKNADLIERFTRGFNYPAESRIKTAADLPKLGIKTFFASNVCAAYDRAVFEKLGGFTDRAIFNEDMVYASGLQKAGYAVYYCADARVRHSHHYTGVQQFRRNFDLAVSQAANPEVFGGIRSESEGIRMVKQTAGYLFGNGIPGIVLLPRLVWQSGMKYLGYRLGKMYRQLPDRVILFCTGNKPYWKDVLPGKGERG